VRHLWYRGILGWYIGTKAAILMGQHIQMVGVRASGRRVSIGADTLIHEGCLLSTRGGLVIGEHVSISAHASLLSSCREINHPDFAPRYRPVVIDDYVWIGPSATILAGVTVGRGAVVLAGAVVTHDVPPRAVVGGVPAMIVTMRELEDPSYTLNYRPLFE
jgi:maltose O-acetyltransferase